MRQILLSDIIIPAERVRKTFDEAAIQELAESIQNNGLINPITLRETDNGFELVAGERRYRALSLLAERGIGIRFDSTTLPPGVVPYTLPADLDEIAALTIELEENVVRRDISWQERVIAEERLHKLKLSQNPAHSYADTARIIHGDKPTGVQVHEVKRDIALAQHLSDPDVAAAKDARTAAKIAKRKMEQLLVAELANRSPNTSAQHQLHLADCVSFIKTLPPNSVDVVIADPPYGIDMHKNPSQSNVLFQTQHTYDDTLSNATAIVQAIAYAKCIKPDAHIWMFCDIRRFMLWTQIYSEAGWYVWPHPIIWDKGGLGSLLGHANGPRHTYEAILFAQRGFKRFRESVPDVINMRSDPDRDHAAQKPVELYEKLLHLSADPGNTVLDPCCGSGTIFPAATRKRCIAIGIEVVEEHYNASKLRMEEE